MGKDSLGLCDKVPSVHYTDSEPTYNPAELWWYLEASSSGCLRLLRPALDDNSL